MICELHFKEEELRKEFVHEMPDGTTFKLPKAKPALQKGSVPSIFPTANPTLNNSKNNIIECVVECNIQKRQIAASKFDQSIYFKVKSVY